MTTHHQATGQQAMGRETTAGDESAAARASEPDAVARAASEAVASDAAASGSGGPGPSSPAAAADAAKDKTIGQVLSHLEAEFPGLTASKVRFLEDRGLVFPERTRTGYRKYSVQDIRRLRYALTLQRDQYLPLKVIKEAVDRRARQDGFEEDPASAAPMAPAAGPSEPSVPPVRDAAAGWDHQPQGSAPDPRRRYGVRELARHTSVSLQMLRDLENFGLISAHEDGTYDDWAARTVVVCARLTSYGLEPRHLRFFRAAAEREVDLVQQSVAPLASRRDQESRDRAARAGRELSLLCTRLHSSMVAGQAHRLWGAEDTETQDAPETDTDDAP